MMQAQIRFLYKLTLKNYSWVVEALTTLSESLIFSTRSNQNDSLVGSFMSFA